MKPFTEIDGRFKSSVIFQNAIAENMETARKRFLSHYRQVAFTALYQYPSFTAGRTELNRIRSWVKKDLDWNSELSLKKASAMLRYSMNELVSTIQLAKYRKIRSSYIDER